jgi:hypothetical protein
MDFDFGGRPESEKLNEIKSAFRCLASDPSVQTDFPSVAAAAADLEVAECTGDEDRQELAFLNLYCELHRAGSTYSEQERSELDRKHGYFNHPGGISPLIKAESFITPSTVSADLGAGNGLQGLMFQRLYPHRTTVLIELSAAMIRVGHRFQKILGIPEHRICWIHDDISNVSLDNVDFLYLYRPSKPIADGIGLYRQLSQSLSARARPLIIFSIADCLRSFLDPSFSVFYSDGHLTCLRYPVTAFATTKP